jgi:hypothetical protein
MQKTHSHGVKKFPSPRFEQFLVPNTMLFDKLHSKSKVPATKCSFHEIYASLRGRFVAGKSFKFFRQNTGGCL